MSTETQKLDMLVEFLRHQPIVQMALADFAQRCEASSSIPAITQHERDNRASLVACAEKSREALTALAALARIGGVA